MTLRQLSFVVRDKNRKDRKGGAGVAKTLLLLIAGGLTSVHAFAADAAKPVAAAPQSISGIAQSDFYAIVGVLMLELLIIFALVINIRLLLRAISSKPELAAAVAKDHSWFWEKFNAAKPIEQEKDILLDHNYDGIQELDNSLPPWWKYGFYLTIIVGCIYIYRYHISNDGPSQQEEYAAEMQKGEEDKAAYLLAAGNNVDENTVTALTDPADIAAGKEMFVKTCAPCHLADGGGVVGPNLTDNYWLHGGSIKDIFKSIKYGWQEKGMKSWKDDFSAKQIQQLASFVKSLKGTKPATPKAEQGELYIEAGAVTTDSTKKKVDSTATIKK
jgi:cytochrome c oxidase cbb3-type subunit 3